jgi:hypothetical protein
MQSPAMPGVIWRSSKSFFFAPDQKPADDPCISAARVFVVDGRLEKFVIGEAGVSA